MAALCHSPSMAAICVSLRNHLAPCESSRVRASWFTRSICRKPATPSGTLRLRITAFPPVFHPSPPPATSGNGWLCWAAPAYSPTGCSSRAAVEASPCAAHGNRQESCTRNGGKPHDFGLLLVATLLLCPWRRHSCL